MWVPSHEDRVTLKGLTPHAQAHVLCLLALVPDLALTSGRRSVGRNRAVGGSPRSFHLTGRAADFVGTKAALELGARIAKAQRITPGCTGPEEVLIHDKGSGVHLHVAW